MPRELPWAAALATGALMLVAVGFTALAPTSAAVLLLTICAVVAPTAAVLGLLIADRHPGNVVGLLLTLVGLALAFTFTKEIGWQVLARHPERWSSLDALPALLNESAWWGYASVAILVLYFPDGRLPGPRWRPVPVALCFSAALMQWRGAYDVGPFRPPLEDLDQPFGPPPLVIDVLGGLAFFTLVGLMLACALSLVVRARNGDRTRRSQVKWLALSGCGVLLYPGLCLVDIAIWGEPSWPSLVVGALGLVGVPLSVAVAVLWLDLYDVDKVLSGTVVWVLLSGAVLGTYAVTALVAGVLLGRDSAAVAAASAVICVLALAPARTRLQRAVDRRLYPLRGAALMAIDRLREELGSGRAEPEELQTVLQVALRDPGLRVGVLLPGTERFVDADGADINPNHGTPVELARSQIGVLLPDRGAATHELLRQVADAAATLVEVVRLRLQLASMLSEVESSRARLVEVGYDERRRLERDLHDGAQQRLVSLGISVRLAQRHLNDGTVDVDGLLDQTVTELGTAVAELRQIAHGLRPSALDDGLEVALAGLVRTVPLPVDVHVCLDAKVMSEALATTAYYVASEAVTNVVKHADATRIVLRVERVEDHIVVRITDDGRGGARIATTSSLADRVAALRGQLQVHSPAGRGTIVEAALPCAS